MLRDYRDLLVWQKSYQICLQVYRATRKFPADERYGLTSQMRRAAVSVPSNIAEGYSRSTTGDYLRSLRFAYASNRELETQAMLARDLDYLKLDEYGKLSEDVREVERMMKSLIKSLERRRSNPRILESSNPPEAKP
jgi:four helix bundle protein